MRQVRTSGSSSLSLITVWVMFARRSSRINCYTSPSFIHFKWYRSVSHYWLTGSMHWGALLQLRFLMLGTFVRLYFTNIGFSCWRLQAWMQYCWQHVTALVAVKSVWIGPAGLETSLASLPGCFWLLDADVEMLVVVRGFLSFHHRVVALCHQREGLVKVFAVRIHPLVHAFSALEENSFCWGPNSNLVCYPSFSRKMFRVQWGALADPWNEETFLVVWSVDGPGLDGPLFHGVASWPRNPIEWRESWLWATFTSIPISLFELGYVSSVPTSSAGSIEKCFWNCALTSKDDSFAVSVNYGICKTRLWLFHEWVDQNGSAFFALHSIWSRTTGKC